MNQEKRILNFFIKVVLHAVAFVILAIMSKQITYMFFDNTPKEGMNLLGKFFDGIDERVAWVLLAIGIVWAVATFTKKALQLRSPLFYIGITYLTFYTCGDIYQSKPLLYLTITLIIPTITKNINLWYKLYTRPIISSEQHEKLRLFLNNILFIIFIALALYIIVQPIYLWNQVIYLLIAIVVSRALIKWKENGLLKQTIDLFNKIDKLLESKHTPKPKEPTLWEYDSIKGGTSDDLYQGRKEIIEMIATEISKMENSVHSFTIGIEGGWGSGKSTVFKHIKNQLAKTDCNGLTVECLDFSPWAFPEGKNLSVEFLFELRRILTKYSFRARFIINSYISILVSNYTLGISRLVVSLFFPRESINRIKEKLTNLILSHRLKLVVFIDDLDRLDKQEIAEVFKMLRNTGDIANTIYVVAYDRINVERFDEFCKGFLDKIINVEVDLTTYDNSILLENLIKDIKEDFKEPLFDEKKGFNNILELQRNPLIIRDISNHRDIKRLKNSIKTRLNLIERINQELIIATLKNKTWKSILDKNFFIFLEIVKIKDYNLYLDIKTQYIYEDEFSNKIKKEYNHITKREYREKIKYKNRYKDELLEYLINKPNEGNSDKKYVFIPRKSLHDYFVSNYEELNVAIQIRSFINQDNEPDYGIINLLNYWEDKSNLFTRALLQIRITLNEAESKNLSSNFCAFVACLVSIEKYYNSLEKMIVKFCTKFGTPEMFKFMNEHRSKLNYKDNLDIETCYDRLYNELTYNNYNQSSLIPWYDTMLASQEERFSKLISAKHAGRSMGILCLVNSKTDNEFDYSSKNIELMKKFAKHEPFLFYTEIAFIKSETSRSIIPNKIIRYIFKTKQEIINNIKFSNMDKTNPDFCNLLNRWIKEQTAYPFDNTSYTINYNSEYVPFYNTIK